MTEHQPQQWEEQLLDRMVESISGAAGSHLAPVGKKTPGRKRRPACTHTAKQKIPVMLFESIESAEGLSTPGTFTSYEMMNFPFVFLSSSWSGLRKNRFSCKQKSSE